MTLRRFAAAALSLATFASPAVAGDGAGLNVLGFSADGTRFAFEQFGSQDGSAFPFSEFYLIDVGAGAATQRAAIRTLIEDEGASVGAAREATAAKAKSALDRLAVSRDGMVEAVNDAVRPSEELLPMDIYPVQAQDVSEMTLPRSPLGPAKIRIETSPAKSDHCDTIAEGRAKAVTVTLARDGGMPETLHIDREPPDARGCPTAYGIAGVYLRPLPDGAVSLAVMVATYPIGFEGPDRRFLAIAARLPARL